MNISPYFYEIPSKIAACDDTTTCNLITSAKEVMFSPGFVCAFVNKITQKLMDGFDEIFRICLKK